MTLLAIILALAGQELLGDLHEHRSFAAYQRWVQNLHRRFRSWPWDGPLGVGLALFLPAFLVAVLHGLLARLFPPLAIVFDAFVLLYCFGPRSLVDDLQHFSELRTRQDDDGARRLATELGGLPGESHGDTAQSVLRQIPVQGNRRVLAVLFWFGLLGPLVGPFAVVLYRLTERACDALQVPSAEDVDFAGSALRLYALLDWLPARAAALTYALAGNYRGVRTRLAKRPDLWSRISLVGNAELLAAAGEGALGQGYPAAPVNAGMFQQQVDEALGLVRRTMWVWVALVVTATLGHLLV